VSRLSTGQKIGLLERLWNNQAYHLAPPALPDRVALRPSPVLRPPLDRRSIEMAIHHGQFIEDLCGKPMHLCTGATYWDFRLYLKHYERCHPLYVPKGSTGEIGEVMREAGVY
jgi:hypothetical protein